MLNPDLPTPGRDKLSIYREKFGAARVASMLPQMQETGLQHGVYILFRMFLAFVRMADYGHILSQFIFPYFYFHLYVGYRDIKGLSSPM